MHLNWGGQAAATWSNRCLWVTFQDKKREQQTARGGGSTLIAAGLGESAVLAMELCNVGRVKVFGDESSVKRGRKVMADEGNHLSQSKGLLK